MSLLFFRGFNIRHFSRICLITEENSLVRMRMLTAYNHQLQTIPYAKSGLLDHSFTSTSVRMFSLALLNNARFTSQSSAAKLRYSSRTETAKGSEDSKPKIEVDEMQKTVPQMKTNSVVNGTGNVSSKANIVSDNTDEKKLSLVQRFKLMYKQYWYVLIPVHVVTSVVWFTSFFMAAKSGVNIIPFLEFIGTSESIISRLSDSDAGYYAIGYAMYKIATPIRYTVTLGGTTLSINYLKKRGFIKPVPSTQELKTMYEGKRDELKERREELKEEWKEKKEKVKGRIREGGIAWEGRMRVKRERLKEMWKGRRRRS